MRRASFVCTLVCAVVVSIAGSSAAPPGPGTPQDRTVDPVVLTGAQFPLWSAGPEISFREPQIPNNYGDALVEQLPDTQTMLPPELRSDCYDENDTTDPAHGDHSCSQPSRLPIRALPGRTGADVRKLLGYRWDGEAFVQIPFQVDERFTRYLSNNASGFSFYSGVDQHTTYVFEREGYRFTADAGPSDPCRPVPRYDRTYGAAIEFEPDPIPGLDDNDEIAFMWRDTGDRAPADAGLPSGIAGTNEVAIADPSNPGSIRYAYVMLAQDGPGAPAPAFDASNGYVHYEPDANARSVFVFSESSYEGYGAAPEGTYCYPNGTLRTDHGSTAQRRPLDTAWVRTPTYAFRYEGRWLMTEIRFSADGGATYGDDVIDRWKARAFQQDPSSETPCCGYEEEDTNWGGSSILMGERSGPVRTIRETWGADSSTNNARREVFYRDVILFSDSLRVHPIPPLDGIYTQWDYNATKMDRYYNLRVPGGVVIDGQNDEVFGNLDDPCNAKYDARAEGTTKLYRDTYRAAGLCDRFPYHQSIDLPDPLLAAPFQWEQVAGPSGSLITRWALREITLGGAHTVLATQYYRDDSCFDDGTGTDPGPRRLERRSEELTTYRELNSTADVPRQCWTPESTPALDPSFVAGTQPDPRGGEIGDEPGDERYYQGDIGTHGLHLLLIAESDNLALTVPTTEIVSEQRMVLLPGQQDNVGERYGRAFEFPFITVVLPRI